MAVWAGIVLAIKRKYSASTEDNECPKITTFLQRWICSIIGSSFGMGLYISLEKLFCYFRKHLEQINYLVYLNHPYISECLDFLYRAQ